MYSVTVDNPLPFIVAYRPMKQGASCTHPPARPKSLAGTVSCRILLKTVFCFLLVWVAGYLVAHLFHFVETLNPLANKIEDFELSDICFAYDHKQSDFDNNILIFRSDSLDERSDSGRNIHPRTESCSELLSPWI